ncbi:3-oxoacyl-acyl-carrier-protein reductase [Daldinia caldariorum]|uniref:3-oxoacyl-acyl-carrier-protein reductase n=1 Tax=Daldinia caldariorum TaxID=326644 RepID=UPI0020078306|nr:3-oxoacyl-acyl-carrier-protein reductase [Daldinia caldariorum]KAI1463384.1 3-oxoacyl-acyl-carrier-protein reductase [Daldinia caldariorum]
MVSPQASSPRIYDGKLALVTSSARGIGAAIVHNLASKGCNIIVNHATAKSDQAAADLCHELQTAHGREECKKLVNAAKTHFTNPETGKAQLDILIHNAALGYFGPFEGVTEADFHTLYTVNVLGPIVLTQEFLPLLPTDRSGRIIMVSSISSAVGVEGMTVYAGTKGALEATACVLSRELAERATVNSICPGAVITDMYSGASEEVRQTLAKWNPVTSLGTVRSLDTPEVQELGKKLGGRPAYDHEIAGLLDPSEVSKAVAGPGAPLQPANVAANTSNGGRSSQQQLPKKSHNG